MELSYETIKKVFHEHGYYAEDSLIWETYTNVYKFANGQIGQDIMGICLEGPPGVGKSSYINVYATLVKLLTDKEPITIKYQCDSTTTKSDLYEEIDVSKAMTSDPENIMLDGKIVEAIKAVNKGDKVILCLDEFDKAKESVSTLLYNFLQEGIINARQLGDIKVEEKYKKNLQVILCKNKKRGQLTEALQRRVKTIQLKEMKPETFYKVALSKLPNANRDILNLVSVLYGVIYDEQQKAKMFARLPACSENLLAIQDATSIANANAPAKYIYSAILANMIKDPNDMETFKEIVEKNEALPKIFKKEVFVNNEISSNSSDEMISMILEDFYPDLLTNFVETVQSSKEKVLQLQNEKEYLEEQLENKEKQIEEYKKNIKEILSNATLQDEFKIRKVKKYKTSMFKLDDNHEVVENINIGDRKNFSAINLDKIKLNESIFDTSNEMWQQIGHIEFFTCPVDMSIFDIDSIGDANPKRVGIEEKDERKIQKAIIDENLMSQCFKDGIILYDEAGIKVGVIKVTEEIEENGNTVLVERYKFIANASVVPVYALYKISDFIGMIKRQMVLADVNLECPISSLLSEKETEFVSQAHPYIIEKSSIKQVKDYISNFKYRQVERTSVIEHSLNDFIQQKQNTEANYDKEVKKKIIDNAKSKHIQIMQSRKSNTIHTVQVKKMEEDLSI